MRRSKDKAKYAYYLEQGLGKTPLTLNDFVECLNRDVVDIALVVAPNSFKLDWALAPEEWGVGQIPTGYWPKHPPPEAGPALYVVNYEAIRPGSRLVPLLVELFEKHRVLLVLDESGEIKNFNSEMTKGAIDLAKRATMVRELNGTPIMQNVMDYWPQLRVLGKLSGVNPYQFRNRHAVMGGFMGKQVLRQDKEGNPAIQNADELYRLLDSCSFRALKKDWRDLPPQIDVPVHLEMTRRQLTHYREMMEDFYTAVEGLDVTAEMVITQMDKLRQISSCLVMQDGEHQFLETPKANPKFQALLDVIHGGPGKTIVVSYYKPSTTMLIEALALVKLKPAFIRGGMKPEELVEQKRRFNEDPDCRVLVGQEGATFRGHTLLGGEGGDRCTKMFFYEASFSYYHYSQIRDRNHRGDQDQPCNYYLPITSPMDQIVFDTIGQKKDVADAVDRIVTAIRSRRF